MCKRRNMSYYGQLKHLIVIILGAVTLYTILCHTFTHLDPSLTPSSLNLYTPYKNSDQLIQSLKSVVRVQNDSQGFGYVKNFDDLKLRNEGYSKYGFNALASRNIGNFREIPDTRHKLCNSLTYPDNLPTASVIICFYNEHYDTLLRTIHTILRRTPDRLLKEIILVDDFSDIEQLHENVRDYLSSTKEVSAKVHLHKTARREGLIRARIFGANLATGDVLIFFDSHVEVNEKWIEPLLSRISENPHVNVVTPIIDIINPDTLEYSSSPLVRGGFNWGLHFLWESLPKGVLQKSEDFVKPIKSPTMAGGLFAMNREYFNNLGQYDSQMDIWGGENLEISFRVWMCGGNLEIIPCSRVGHIFRKQRPYTDPHGEDSMTKNSLRLAQVWLDQYKEHYFAAVPQSKSMNYGDVSERVELRKKMNCKSFDWYLNNVYPELILPNDDANKLKEKSKYYDKPHYQRWDERKRNYVNSFMIRLANTNLCVTSEKDIKTKGSFIILRPCLRAKNQVWYETDLKELILAQLLCLDTGTAGEKPKLSKCHELGGTQQWEYASKKDTAVYNRAGGTCLGASSDEANSYVVMKLCSSTENVKWFLV